MKFESTEQNILALVKAGYILESNIDCSPKDRWVGIRPLAPAENYPTCGQERRPIHVAQIHNGSIELVNACCEQTHQYHKDLKRRFGDRTL